MRDSKNQNKGRSFVLGIALALAMGSAGCGGKGDVVTPYEFDFVFPPSLQQYDGLVQFIVTPGPTKDGEWSCQYEAKGLNEQRTTSVTACYFTPSDKASFPLSSSTVFLVQVTAHGPAPCAKFGMVGQTCDSYLSPSEYPTLWPSPTYVQLGGQAAVRITQAYYDKYAPILKRGGGSFLTVDWIIAQQVAPAAPTP